MIYTFVARLLLLLSLLLVASQPAYAATITFEADESIILNPERGLAKFMIVGDDSIGDIEQLRADNHTLAWGIIKLEAYRTNPIIPAAKLTEISNWLAAVRTNRVKAVLRVSYHEVPDFSENDATLDVQEAHLTQLGQQAFVPYEDVIVALQAGGIGAYGEWYYTTSDLTTKQSRKRLLDKMYEVSGDDAFVMVRTPFYKQEYEESGALDDRIYRTGHYNDCFLSSPDDTGTYGCYPSTDSCPTIDALQTYSSNDSSLVPIGGETCNATALNDCPAALEAMKFYGYSFINTLWFSSIRSKWESQGCFDDITKKLGYRYELVSAEIPDSVSAGSDFSVSVALKNTGWAPMYHDRPVFIRLADADGAELFYSPAEAEPRNWFASDETYTFTATIQAPVDLNTDSVSFALWMPDSNPVNYRIPEYSVRFANVDVWDAEEGVNVLATGVPVVLDSSSCDTQYLLPSNEWTTLALPCQPAPGTTVADLFADDILLNGVSATYGRDWIVYAYNASGIGPAGYVDPGAEGFLSSGTGFWIIQTTGSTTELDLPDGSVIIPRDEPDANGCSAPLGCAGLSLTGKANNSLIWQLLGNPFHYSVNTNNVSVSTANGVCSEQTIACNLSSARLANVTGDTLWHYSNGSYEALRGSSLLDVWDGFWFHELPSAAGNSPVLLLPLSGAL